MIFLCGFLSVLIFAPDACVHAELVNCGKSGQPSCTICDLIDGIHGVIQFLVELMSITGIVIITIAGVMYIVSSGNPSMTTLAKSAIKNVLIGITVILVAFISITFIINTVFQNEKSELKVKENGLSGFGGNMWNFTGDCESSGSPSPSPTPSPSPSPSPSPTPQEPQPLGNISKECNKYDNAFNSAARGDKTKACLYKAIAMAESTCNPTAQNGDGCGLMQIESDKCQYYKDHPEESVQKSSEMLADYASKIDKYKTKYGYDIGSSYGQNGEKVKYGNSIYDRGNDDLIASYNAGTADTLDKHPFNPSNDCDPKIPAWQCHNNPGEFGTTTQKYVPNVQKYQRQCMGK